MSQFGNDALHEVEQRVFMRIAVEFVDYIVSRVYQTLASSLRSIFVNRSISIRSRMERMNVFLSLF